MSVDLKEYTTRAVELETAIYTQKKLMINHKQIINEQAPIEPVKRPVVKPHKPQPPKDNNFTGANNIIWWSLATFLLIMGIGIGIFGLTIMDIVPFGGFVLLFIGGGMIFYIIRLYNIREENKSLAEQSQQMYNQSCTNYENLMREYTNDINCADKEYSDAYNQYRVDVAAYDRQSNSLMDRHSKVLTTLEETLQSLYDENVVYPKYRNMVAMTTINEYLMSGRCSELEGANGAYNLYEMELRQNIIINQLSNIVSNLEQIRNSQFLLYQELSKANDTIDQICEELRNMGDTSKLTAYFTAVTAKAAISPKIIKGVIR